MTHPIDELADYIVANGDGFALGSTLVRFALTAAPNVQAALIPYQGQPSEEGFGTAGIRWEYPRIQVVIRGARNETREAAERAIALYDLTSRIGVRTLGTSKWLRAMPMQMPFSMGVDDSGRPLFAFSLACHREPGA